MEQGTIVDRIDVSLRETVERTRRGNKELMKAKESLEKGCANTLLRLLTIANFVLFVLLLLKFR